MSPEAELQLIKDVESIRSTVASLNKSVNGNGKPGMYDRLGHVEVNVDKLNTKVDCHLIEHEEAETEENKKKSGRADFSNKIWLLVIGMFITNIGTLIFLAIRLSVFGQ